MRRRAALALAALHLACGRSARDVQRDYAQTLRPRPVEARPETEEGGPAPQVRTLRVRIHADADYRSQTLRWQDRVASQIDRAGRVLEAQFGVRLEVQSFRPWERVGHSAQLDAALEDLAAVDSGEDVDWVIGFVSPVQLVSGDHEHLGLARVFGRHLVLRGMLSVAEWDAVAGALDRLSADERGNVLRERQVHRETAVLLHEWAHTLGAFHERSSHSIMSPTYDASQSSFSPTSVRLVRIGLAHRAAAGAEGRRTWAEAYRGAVATLPADVAWDAETRAEALALADRLASGVDLAAIVRPLPPEDVARLVEASQADREGDIGHAWDLVAPLAMRHRSDPTVLYAACSIQRRRAPGSEATLAACRAAATVPGAEPGASLQLAHLLLDRGDGPGALAALERVEAELLARPDAEEGSLVYLAQLYGRSESCTAAERVAARAKDAEGARRVAAECGRLRTWIGLPAGDPLVPEAREAEYVSALRTAHGDVEAGRLQAARRRASEVEKAFPGAAGPAVVRCAAAARAGFVVAARTACGRAARVAASAAYPQYVLGLVASAEGRWVDARAYLSRSLALDDAQPDVWRRLALVHRRLGETGDLEALRARHRARFGEDLKTPPTR